MAKYLYTIKQVHAVIYHIIYPFSWNLFVFSKWSTSSMPNFGCFRWISSMNLSPANKKLLVISFIFYILKQFRCFYIFVLEYCLNNIARNFLVALLFLNSDIADDKSFLFTRLNISNFILLILLISYLRQPLGPLGFMLSVSCILSTPSTAYKNLSIRLGENSGEGANIYFLM